MAGNSLLLNHSLTWTQYGCCVSSSNLIWLTIIFFIFTVISCMFCCAVLAFVRWMYRRRIRSKSESLQKRYEQEGKSRKELEFKLKEIAMRPTHGHHHHLLERPKDSESKDSSLQQFALSKSNIANHQKFLTNITQNTAYFSIPKAPVATQKYKLFTGNTPLTSKTSSELSPTQGLRLFTGTTPLPSSRAEPTRPSTTYLTAGTKTIPLSVSSSTGIYARSSSPSTKVEAIHMEPRDVAATTHAIAMGRLQKEETRPPFPSIVLLNKDERPRGQCPLEKAFVIPSRSETLVSSGDKRSTTGSVHTSSKEPVEKSPVPSRTAITAHGYVLHSLMNELSASPVVSNEKMDNVPSDIIERKVIRLRRSSDEASPKDDEKKRKRKRKSTREQPPNVPEVNPPPPASAFFPYWSGFRQTIAKIEPMSSTSGKPSVSKVETSETTKWEPQKSGRSPKKRSASSQPGSTSKIKSTRQSSASLEAPLNVYELRLRAEKAKAAQIAKRMQEVEKPAETQGGAHLKENVLDSKRLLPSRPDFRQSDDRPLY
ncbi:unnamed protein product [Cylicocyclus nassatus]|uniref:Uncharacterized protein n=1 Tax=Cylicocyclus nassatus TaxID=53992 RepID=A0AA36M6K2_CYLNA|nr:unnamed protein product [Cylicocyclus nassatus]